VAATHGRSLWILDVTALRQMTPTALKEAVHFYAPKTAYRWQTQPSRGRTIRRFVGQNPPAGAQFYYSLGKKAAHVSLRVLDIDGSVIRRLTGGPEPGLHRVRWDLTRGAANRTPARDGRGSGRRPTQGTEAPRPLLAGAYRVVLTVDGKEFTQTVRVEGDPGAPARILAEEDEQQEDR